jgi:hypothetical protein
MLAKMRRGMDSHLQRVVLEVPAVVWLITKLAAIAVVSPLKVVERCGRALGVCGVHGRARRT